MEITVSQQQGRVPVTVFHVKGEMTADTVAPFESEATAALQAGAKNLLLDLAGVPFIGSFGIRSLNKVLMALHASADGQSEEDLRQSIRTGRGKSTHLKLVNVDPQVMKVLEISGLDMLLEVHRNLKEAVASF